MSNFLYQINRGTFQSSNDFETLRQSFDTLTPSDYKDGSYRLRRYSRFSYDKTNKAIALQETKAFVQGDDLNRFQGNVARTYDNLTNESFQSQAFLSLMDDFVKSTNLPEHSLIEVHQMRILAKDGNESTPAAPEGIHQDGFDFVGVFTINRKNVKDGALMLWHGRECDKPIATLNPEAGDICIVNDQVLWHSASDIRLEEAGEGYWDLLVLTAHNQPFEMVA